jgi:hypothetical protein
MVPFPKHVYAATKRELRNRTLDAITAAVESEPLLEGLAQPQSPASLIQLVPGAGLSRQAAAA